ASAKTTPAHPTVRMRALPRGSLGLHGATATTGGSPARRPDGSFRRRPPGKPLAQGADMRPLLPMVLVALAACVQSPEPTAPRAEVSLESLRAPRDTSTSQISGLVTK